MTADLVSLVDALGGLVGLSRAETAVGLALVALVALRFRSRVAAGARRGAGRLWERVPTDTAVGFVLAAIVGFILGLRVLPAGVIPV